MQIHSVPDFYVVSLDTVASTNDWAKLAWAEKTIKSGAVIVAETQTHGRGQMQTLWHDNAGENLLMTLVVELSTFPADHFFSINEAVSLALMDVLEPMFKTKIKWPNDLYIGHKKVAGILMETSIQGGSINVAFIGIGLNVNQMQFPSNIKATSLAQTLGRPMDKTVLLEKILTAFKARLPLMYLPKKLSKQYAEKLLGVDEFCQYKSGAEFFKAKIHAVLADGQLVLQEQHTQNLRSFRFKEVELVL